MKQLDLRIEGMNPDATTRLRVAAAGFKHSATLCLAAAPLLPSPLTINNLPRIGDVTGMLDCLQYLGCGIKTEDNAVTIDNHGLTGSEVPASFTQDLHGALYLLPTILGRVGRAKLGPFGGCRIGERNVDGRRPTSHVLEVLRCFGALADEESSGALRISLPEGELRATTIDVQDWSTEPHQVRGPLVSGVTKVAILAALGVAKARTNILHPYLRAETQDLLSDCRKAGWNVQQSSRHISIEASQPNRVKLDPVELPADSIEIMTYVALAVIANRTTEISITPATDVEVVLAPELAVLRAMGVEVVGDKQTVTITPHAPHHPFKLETGLPGIYSDNQPFFALMASTCTGESVIRDHVWRNRFSYADGLRTMGVDLSSSESRAEIVIRPSRLRLSPVVVNGHDLRAAAVLAIAAAARSGVTTLRGAESLTRGYEDLLGNLRRCGARVSVLTVEGHD